jgi:hypothetical protein
MKAKIARSVSRLIANRLSMIASGGYNPERPMNRLERRDAERLAKRSAKKTAKESA